MPIPNHWIILSGTNLLSDVIKTCSVCVCIRMKITYGEGKHPWTINLGYVSDAFVTVIRKMQSLNKHTHTQIVTYPEGHIASESH